MIALVYSLSTDPFELADSAKHVYRKELIHVGEYAKGQQHFMVDEALLSHWHKTSSQMLADGVRIPVPLEHTNNPEKNRGHVIGTELGTNREGIPALFSRIQFRDAEAAKLALTADVSIYVPPEFVSGNKKRYVRPIRHVALTDYPVIPGLDGFEVIVASWREQERDEKGRFGSKSSPDAKEDKADADRVTELRKSREIVDAKEVPEEVGNKLSERLGALKTAGWNVIDSFIDDLTKSLTSMLENATQRMKLVSDAAGLITQAIKGTKPVPPVIAAWALSHVDNLLWAGEHVEWLLSFNPDQPRDADGRFAGGSGNTPKFKDDERVWLKPFEDQPRSQAIIVGDGDTSRKETMYIVEVPPKDEDDDGIREVPESQIDGKAGSDGKFTQADKNAAMEILRGIKGKRVSTRLKNKIAIKKLKAVGFDQDPKKLLKSLELSWAEEYVETLLRSK